MAIKARVRNFQSIEDASIVIDGLTVLTGTNNAGKSALFRAIRGAFTNAPGHAFVRTGQSHCTVDLEFDDGRTLTWMKGKGVNTYVVNGKKLEKVDKGVPAEVRVFGVDPIQVGDKELWPQIAPQVTGVVFLLNETGSLIAEAVADVTRVKQLTVALKECDSDRRAGRASIKERTETAAALAEQRTKFAGLDVIVEQLAELDKRHEAGVRLEKALLNLDRMATRHRNAKLDVESLLGLEEVAKLVPSEEKVAEALQSAKEINELRSLRDRLETARATTEGLQGLEEVARLVPSEERITYVNKFRQGIGITVDLITRYERAEEDFRRAQEAQTALGSIKLDEELVKQLEKFTKAVLVARQLQARYAKARKELQELDAEISARTGQRDAVEGEVVRLLGSAPECPTCGQDLASLRTEPLFG